MAVLDWDRVRQRTFAAEVVTAAQVLFTNADGVIDLGRGWPARLTGWSAGVAMFCRSLLGGIAVGVFEVRIFAIRRRPGRRVFEVRWRVGACDRSRQREEELRGLAALLRSGACEGLR